MRSAGIIFALLTALAVAALVTANVRANARMAAAKALNAERAARIEAIRATPAYAALLAHGSERCPGQPDRVIWICGATLTLPASPDAPPPDRRLCSSPEAPEYVGSFPLPTVESLDPETPGEIVTPRTSVTRDGYYHHGWFLSFRSDDAGHFAACRLGEAGCRQLWASGQDNLPQGFPPRPLPASLATDLPDPTAASRNHTLEIDAFLDLDGRAVTYTANGYTEGRENCQFVARHPEHGYVLGLGMPCAEQANWRNDLRAVLAEMSQRTLSYAPADCAVPPADARIRSKAHRTDVDSHQAMRDWAIARD